MVAILDAPRKLTESFLSPGDTHTAPCTDAAGLVAQKPDLTASTSSARTSLGTGEIEITKLYSEYIVRAT
jgi:hypothetical protein